MKNRIHLHGIIKDYEYSHKINDVEYEKANLIVKRMDGKEDIINLRFKKSSNPYKELNEIDLVGYVRSYSRIVNEKNKVDIYVFTYFDKDLENEKTNEFEIEGRICKIDPIRETRQGKKNIHFIIANNIESSDGQEKRLNSYLPCIAWGSLAKDISKTCFTKTKIRITGELHSREYKKQIDSDEYEIRIAHELLVKTLEIIED